MEPSDDIALTGFAAAPVAAFDCRFNMFCICIAAFCCPNAYSITQQSHVVTSAEEGGYVFGSVCLSVCLSVRRITRKLVNGF